MSLRRCDRYLLRQMLGPFFLALAGLSLFILLNLILRLSELMVDRGIGIAQLIRLLIFWMPELIAWAIPMSALFAVFLGLGRMDHDREIMALESIGVSLRRVLLPLLIASVGLSFLTFAVYNWVMPESKNAAQRTYREILLTQSVPRISANTFFTGSNNQYFYVRQYDADDGAVHDVLIYDVSGRLFPQAESQITMVTAESGTWDGDNWDLSSGKMYGFSHEGNLIYSGTFNELTIPVTQTADQIWSQSKSPSEMGIRELLARIDRARTSGLPINESIVELHQRFALPLSAFLFVLVGGAVSLMFGSRNRSTGIIIALLITGLYQGTYFWMQALGRRGAMNPTLAAWIPNLLFGLIGFLLYVRVDRLASRDTWNRLRSRLPFLTSLVLVAVLSVPGKGQDVPLHLECDDLFISTDRTEIIAQGSVRAQLEDADLRAESLYLKQDSEGQWLLTAEGSITLDLEEFALSGDRVVAEVVVSESGTRPQSAEASGFRGQSSFTNTEGEEQILYFHGESGQLVFDDSGELDFIEIRDGEITTCNCCDRPFQSQPYTLRAKRLLFYPGRLIVAFGLVAKISGQSILWLPVYVQPLKDTLESPLFPAFGTGPRGVYFKWNMPFYVSESLYGSVLSDYYSKHNDVGLGVISHYAFAEHKGQIRIYSDPAKDTDAILEFSARHELPAGETWSGQGNVDLRIVGDATDLDYGAHAQGASNEWTVRVSATREIVVENSDDDDPTNDVANTTERIPQIALTRSPWMMNSVLIQPTVEVGRYREQLGDKSLTEALRLSSGLSINSGTHAVLGVDLTPRLNLRTTAYVGDMIEQSKGSLQAAVGARWHDISATYDLVMVDGASPFEFDAEVATHHIGWDITRSGWGTITISGGIALNTGHLDPLQGKLTWTDWASWILKATYELSDVELTSLLLSGDRRNIRGVHLDWSIPYVPVESRFGVVKLHLLWPILDEPVGSPLNTLALAVKELHTSLEVDIDASLDRGNLAVATTFSGGISVKLIRLDGSVEFSNLEFDTLSLELELDLASGWGASIAWTYSGGAPSLAGASGMIFWDIGECLRIGLERKSGEIWIYGSILAFPEAILRYAPETSQVRTGD